ncbi:MAG: septation protein IspZ [Kordiimonadaceae bacterium]|nr:septation protein IspZ [Kordiimonadaceae bacterium]MBO6568528.1 septation protein IspZ [Kordiimonadaceae bacterium]MBO6963743.1 septation protein IspZ [Kordiimonadaceae bacterium]
MTDNKAKETESTRESEAQKPAGWIKPAIEFGSLIAFFVAFQLGGIYAATVTFMVAHPLSMIAAKKLLGHIAKMQWFTLVVVLLMGGLTLWLQDETFVKMKLTVINSIFASILLFGLVTNRLYVKTLMGSALEMPDHVWRVFTRNLISFFLASAALNEFIWRSFSTDTWVTFKTFGYLGLFLTFMIGHGPLFAKYMPEED